MGDIHKLKRRLTARITELAVNESRREARFDKLSPSSRRKQKRSRLTRKVLASVVKDIDRILEGKL